MATQNILSAPKAFIKIGGQTAGYIKNLSFSENIQVVEIAGLGSLTTQAAPAVRETHQFSMGQFFIDFEQPSVKAMLNRFANSEDFISTITLGEFMFDIYIFSKDIVSDPSTKIAATVSKEGKKIAVLESCKITSQSFNLTEGGIAGLDTSGIYLKPVTFNS